MLFVIGASGAGKTAAVQALEQQQLPGVAALTLPVLDSTHRSIAEVADLLREYIDQLRGSLTSS